MENLPLNTKAHIWQKTEENTDETRRSTTASFHTVELKSQCRLFGERFILSRIFFPVIFLGFFFYILSQGK